MIEAQLWLFNHPAPAGADIKGTFASVLVDFPQNTMKSFPYEVGNALKNRYPFLAEVVDHPSVAGRLPPPPSGVVGDPMALKPEGPPQAPPVETDVTKAISPFMCVICQLPYFNKRGLTMHTTMKHGALKREHWATVAARNKRRLPSTPEIITSSDVLGE